jgi:hypothetical protein
MVDLRDNTLATAVKAFTAEFAGHEELIRYGQFYLTNRLVDDMLAQIETTIMSSLAAKLAPDAALNAVTYFKTKMSVAVNQIDVNALLTIIDTLQLPPELRIFFTPGPSVEAQVQAMYSQVWDSDAIGPGPPFLTMYPTLQKAQAASKLEHDRCFAVVRALSRKLLKARGVTSLPPAGKVSQGNIAGAYPQEVVAARPLEGMSARQIVRYGNATGLAPIYQAMREAIKQKGIVQCGVLSGARHETHVYGDPEHYVVVFAYRKVGGEDVFLFWDPDAARSNIGITGWGRGFGCLLARPNSFSTALDDVDHVGLDLFAGAGSVAESPTFGNHLGTPIRHCYQVYSVQTLPM